jgi:hypothetical protein
MPILIDGNNLLHTLPPEHRRRGDVRRLVLDACRRERMKVTVVFDGPPPAGAPSRELLGAVTVVYSDTASASAREWVVVTDDRGLAQRVRQRGAGVRTTAEWRQPRRTRSRGQERQPKLSSHEVAEWEEFFSGGRQDDD